MKKGVVVLAIAVLSLFGLGCSGMFLQGALAIGSNVCEDTNIDEELRKAAGCELEEEDTAVPLAINLIEVALSIVGIITVIIIVYGGISYVISVGDAMKIRRAQNTILYGIVGLVIAMLAYSIVYFVSKGVWG